MMTAQELLQLVANVTDYPPGFDEEIRLVAVMIRLCNSDSEATQLLRAAMLGCAREARLAERSKHHAS
jgi:hypothetical protein